MTTDNTEGIDIVRSFLADTDLFAGTIDAQRAAMDLAATGAPPPPGVDVEGATLGGRPAEWLIPHGVDRTSTVLYLHGGGYCSGSLDSHRGLAGRIALAAGLPVVSLGYRLAPEDPFPAALDDAVAAYRQLLELGHRPDRLAIMGDSAGGGLTMASLLALRAEGVPLPAAAICLSPWVDLTQTADSFREVGDRDPMVSKVELDQMAGLYLDGTDPRHPRASPLFDPDLAGLPPLRIEVGEEEVLLDDSLRLAERVASAGGTVELLRWPDMIHVFQAFPAELLPTTGRSLEGIGAFLRTHLVAGG